MPFNCTRIARSHLRHTPDNCIHYPEPRVVTICHSVLTSSRTVQLQCLIVFVQKSERELELLFDGHTHLKFWKCQVLLQSSASSPDQM